MAKIKFTSALNRFFPDLTEMEIHASTIQEVLIKTEQKYPGLKSYLLEEDGSLRKHVNIFINDELIHDRKALTDEVSDDNEILIFQALSGG